MNRFGRFLVNGTLMTAVALFMRTVALAFNVYISNQIGAEGLGLFTLISSVYGFALTLATSGINLASTRLISEAIGHDNTNDMDGSVRKSKKLGFILARCIIYALLFSVSVAVLMFLLSDYIGVSILRDRRTVSSLRVLALSLVPIALSSALSGYFSAVRRVYKNAAVQIFGQFTKIYATVLLFGSAFYKDTETACLSMVIGAVISEMLSFLLQWFLYAKEKRKDDGFVASDSIKKATNKKLLSIALPVAFSAYLRSGLISIEHVLIPIGLEKSCNDKSASLAAYGTVHSMVFPLVLFPSAILSSFAGLLVPEIAESGAAGDTKRIERITSKVIRTALIFSIGVAGIITSFSNTLGDVVYPGTDAGKYIAMIAPLIPVMYIDTSVDAILKGLGQQVYTMWVNIIDSSLSVLLVILLLPKYGIIGYVITVYFTELINAALSITRLLSVTSLRVKVFSWIAKPLISVVAATFAVKAVFDIIYGGSAVTNVQLWIFIAVTSVIYFLFLFITRTLEPKQVIRLINYGKKSIM